MVASDHRAFCARLVAFFDFSKIIVHFLTWFSYNKLDGKPSKTRSEYFNFVEMEKTLSCEGATLLPEVKNGVKRCLNNLKFEVKLLVH